MGRCLLCQETVSDEALADLSHLRLMHPDRYEEPILWPDGEPLIVDCTLEPDDFGGAQDDGSGANQNSG